jgi:hypothetical protein
MKLKIVSGLCVLALLSGNAQSATIVDAAFEPGVNGLNSNGGWYSTAQQSGFYSRGANPEGAYISHSNANNRVWSDDISNGQHVIGEGEYTISFVAGNWNNSGFSNFDISFAGMGEAIATSKNRQLPGLGQWALWSFTWEVDEGSSFIGNALSFNAQVISAGNSAIDGVGNYSDLGNGFLVDYTASEAAVIAEVSEPMVFSFLGLGMLGLVLRKFRKA